LRIRTGLALFLVLLFVSYLFYIPFDDWWYLRFLLSGFPVLLVLAVGFVSGATRIFGRTGGILLLTAVVMLVFGWEAIVGRARRVYTLQRLEARYPVVGHDLAKTAPPDAIFLAMIQSGSLRLYTGRMTVRYDFLPPGSLDRAIDVLRARGFHPFFLLERQEEAAFRERFGGASPTGRLDWRPVRVWNTLSEVALYDPADRERGER
jgi:hypothetical protein